MKLLQEFKNEYNNITYRLYELDCGIKLIHLENPATVNFDFFSLQEAGCIYEDLENVPHGTAHLTEHLLHSPNSTFKTLDDVQKFEEGNKSRPAIHTNAGTWFKHMDLRSFSNIKGTDRVLERIDSMIDFPYSKFKKNLINEKRVVTAERSRKLKLEKDNFIQKVIFLEGKQYPQFAYNIIGELKDIENINIDDLKKYFTNRFLNKGAIFSIQSNKVLSDDVFSKLEKMGNKYTAQKNSKLPEIILKNDLTFGYFYDENATGVTLDLTYFDPTNKKINYQKSAIEGVLNSIIRRIGYLLLREDKGLIYGLQTFKEDTFTMYHNIKCLRFVVENSRLKEMLATLEPFFFKDIEKFIKSEKGTRWINNILSNYIFPTTIGYEQDLPYDIAMDYSEYNELYNYNLYVEEVKKITKADLLEELKKLQSTPPHIWVESNLPKKEVEKIVKESTLWKRFK